MDYHQSAQSFFIFFLTIYYLTSYIEYNYFNERLSMKKLRFTVISLLLILIFVGCMKSNNSDEVSDIDSIQVINDTIKNNEIDSLDQISSEVLEASELDYAAIDMYDASTNLSSVQADFSGNLGSGMAIDDIGNLASESISKMGSARDLVSSLRSFRGSNISATDNLGFSVGGAKDIGNFRENIKNNYMPVVEDITHEGIFYDYFFDNNITKKATHLFEPAYTSYKNRHPITKEEEIYLSVGLNSNLKASSFKRKKLNLVIVLDISGSMNEKFNRYYNDNTGNNSGWDDRDKIEIAKECMIDLTKNLQGDDRFAVVLFNNESHIAKPFNLISKTNMEQIRSHIDQITAVGSTNMYAGISAASDLYDNLPKYSNNEYDNRIIFLTDAMPNTDVTDKNSIWRQIKDNAEKKIYTSFIGVGVDLNNELINYITKTPGANYYSVHNAEDFKKRMDTQFEFMVTPLVFDLTLHLKSNNYEIEKIYGAPEADQATGEIMKVNTLFPSETKDGKTRGGIILIKLKKTGNDSDLELRCSYKDRNGIPDFVSEKINFSHDMKGTDNGIRKAVLLSRYVNLMHDWIENKTITVSNGEVDDWLYGKTPEARTNNTSWERRSARLSVNSYYQEVFKRFKTHFNSEAKAINDEDLKQESDILDFLTDYDNNTSYHNDNQNHERSDREKVRMIEDWSMNILHPLINAKYRKYQLKKPISGKLYFTLFFSKDILQDVKITGEGSISDRNFIMELRQIALHHKLPGIGDYRFTTEMCFQ